jgi:hypothetical protein
MTTYFCDGLKEVSIVNGVARLELYRFEPTGREPEFRGTKECVLALPISGLVEAITILEGVRERLIAKGLVQAHRSDEPSLRTRNTSSPNFVRDDGEKGVEA